MKNSRTLVALILLWTASVVSVPAAAETRFVFAEPALDGGWIEITPIEHGGDAELLRLEAGEHGVAALQAIRPGLAMTCRGGSSVAVACSVGRLEHGEQPLTFGPGRSLVGRYLCGDTPCVQAQVSVIPVPLPMSRPFSLPLLAEGDRLRRHVVTDEQGRFRTPLLAPGIYLLETQLADGAIHHSESFEIPPLEALAPGESPESFDLGDLQVETGLSIEFLVLDSKGQPVASALVGGGQGARPSELREFRGETDADGRADVSGWNPLHPARTVCRAPGFSVAEQRFDQPPPFVLCELQALARILGRVESVDGDTVIDAHVTITSDAGDSKTLKGGEEGRFEIADLDAGTYELTFVAPGFDTARTTVELEPGEGRDLETVALTPGEELSGRVVDAETGEPVEAARIEILQPVGGGFTHSRNDGGFDLLTTREETVTLRIGATGYADLQVRIPPPSEDEQELIVELSRGGRILAQVSTDAHQPCVRCRLTLRPAPPGSETLFTDGAGEALSRPLPPGRYSVNLQRSTNRGSMLIVEGGVRIREAEVRAGETTVVRFEPRTTTARLTFTTPLLPGSFLQTRGGHSGRLDAQADGSFLVPLSETEATEVFVVDPGHSAEARQGSLIAEDAGENVRWELGSAVVSGTVLEPDQPHSPVRALSTTTGSLQAFTRLASDGSFILPHLQPGTYNLVVGERSLAVVSLARGEVRHLEPLDGP